MSIIYGYIPPELCIGPIFYYIQIKAHEKLFNMKIIILDGKGYLDLSLSVMKIGPNNTPHLKFYVSY